MASQVTARATTPAHVPAHAQAQADIHADPDHDDATAPVYTFVVGVAAWMSRLDGVRIATRPTPIGP